MFFFLHNLYGNKLEKISLQLLWLDQFQFAGYYMAKEKGFYRDVGLDVTIKPFKKGILTVDEVIENRSDYGIARSSLLIDRSNGKKVVALAAIYQSTPIVLIAKKDSNIKTIEDIKDKSIMLTDNALGNTSLRAMIMSRGLTFSQTKVEKHSLDINDLINNNIDLMSAYSSNEPYVLKKMGIDTVVFAPKDYGFKFYGDILFTSENELINNPSRVKKFTEASLKGWSYAFDNIEESVELIQKKYNIQNKSKDALIYEALELKKLAYFETNKIGSIDKDNIRRISDIYKVLGLTSEDLNANEFVYDKNKIILTKKERLFLSTLKKLKVHNEMNWPPYNFNNLDQPKGFSIDIMNLIAKKMGIDIEYISGYSWNEFLELIKNKDIDIMLNIVNTKERREFIKFTTSYGQTLPSIFVLKDENRFDSLKSLEGKTVAIPKGFYTQGLLEEKHPKIKLHLTKGILEALKALMFKKVDAVVTDYGVAIYLMEKNGITTIKAINPVEDRSFRSPLNIGVRDDMPMLRNILQKGLEQISEEEFIQLRRKWFGSIFYEETKNSSKIEFTDDEKKFFKNKKEIIACIESNRMPYSNYSSNKYIGITPDYLKVFSKELNTPIKILNTNSQAQSNNYIREDKCDILPATVIIPDYLKEFKYTTEYLFSPLVIATKIDKPFVSDIDDLENKTIGVIEGSAYKENLLNYNPRLKIKTFRTINEGLFAVNKNQIFGLVDALSTISYNISKEQLHNIKIAGKLNDSWNFRIATKKETPELISIFQKLINNIDINEHDKIQNKWSSIKFEQGFNYSLFFKIALALVTILIFIILYLWNVKLKKVIRKRKRIGKELENSIKNFQTLVNSTIEALLILDENHNCIEVNDSAVKLFKAQKKVNLQNKNIFDLIAKDSIEKVKENIILENNTPYEVNLIKNDGTVFPALVKGQNSIRDNQTIRIASIIDLSELKQKDKLLQQQSSLAQMGEMISMIAHQWRQPLGAIASTAINVKTKMALNVFDLNTKEGRENHLAFLDDTFSKVELYVKNLSTTIDDFRSFYKPNKKKEIIEINKPIKQALNIIEASLQSRGINVDVDLKSTAKVEIYNNEMVQVILNLIKNAQDNFEENNIKDPEICIWSKDLDDKTIMEVIDNGSGMSSDIINKIFEPYFSTKDSKNGTGLGLYMSKIIIEEHHNGTLEVECKNNKTFFTVTLSYIQKA